MKNLMDEYIDFTTSKMKRYIRLIFASRYNSEITDEYIKTYVNSRYYNVNLSEKSNRAFYLKIVNELNEKSETLKKRLGKEKEKIIDDTKVVFNYLLFFDSVRKVENFKNIPNIKEVTQKLIDEIKNEFGIKIKEEVEETLYKEISADMLEKELFLDKFETDDFILNFVKHKSIDSLYYVDLEHHIKLPNQYSDLAIEEVYNSGIVAEDKLEIEYILLSIIAIKDIIDGNFKDTYIAEFATSLFKKKQKLNSVLELLNNQALQEKIKLNITYEEFTRFKKTILGYVNKGFDFAITLDDTIKSVDEVGKLKMFKYVILPKNLKLTKEILQNKKLFNNIIEQ